MSPEKKIAECAFENPKKGDFCPLAQSRDQCPRGIFDICLKVNRAHIDLKGLTMPTILMEILRENQEIRVPQLLRRVIEQIVENKPSVPPPTENGDWTSEKLVKHHPILTLSQAKKLFQKRQEKVPKELDPTPGKSVSERLEVLSESHIKIILANLDQ